MYKAIVSRISVRPHPNADKLKLGTCYGHQVVVGLDTQDGQVGVFFPPDGQLSLEYCEVNKLLKKDGGYFDDNRRVRAQKFRGEKSEGLWMPLSSLNYCGALNADIGMTFTEINGYPICNRYETPRTRRARLNKNKVAIHNLFFKKHIETEQFRFYKDSIPDNSYIVITEKLHGTSGRYGHVPSEQKPKWWQRLLGIKPGLKYKYLLGSRNVILNSDVNPFTGGYYGDETFRYRTVEDITLHKGETLYYEIVGSIYTEASYTQPPQVRDIMSPQPIKDKELKAKYGDKMRYTYGATEGHPEIYVYRITMVNEEGVVTELSWNQVKQRCKELGLNYTPELETVVKVESYPFESRVETRTYGPSTLDARHIREGVVIRVESEHGTQWYKNKSFDFGVLEGYIKDQDDYEDQEEAS